MKRSTYILSFIIGSFFIIPTQANLSNFLKRIPKHDAYVAGSAVVLTAAACIPASLYVANKYHPAALAKQKLAEEKAEKEKKERLLKEQQEKQRQSEERKSKAQQCLVQLRHKYNTEINLLPNDALQNDKDRFILIIKSKYNNHKTPFSIYFHNLNHDLEKLHNLENILPTDKESERMILINHLEHTLRSYNLTIADNQKAEEEVADQKEKRMRQNNARLSKKSLRLKNIRQKLTIFMPTKQSLNAYLIISKHSSMWLKRITMHIRLGQHNLPCI